MKKRIMLFLACLFTMVSVALAQSKVTGVVTSIEDGEPIVGASVLVKGTTLGTVTDLDGNFTIAAIPSSAKTLIVSYVGMKTKEVAIKANLKITLDPDQEVLEEVVVTAQGLTRKDKSIGYAAQKVNGEKLQMARQTDLGTALAGKIAGARFTGNSGATFDSGSIVLRGTTDFTSPAGSEPIYVVDGTITNKNSVNMDDVASINVLKGSAATSLYGSQGANGAIIITSKGAVANDGKGHVDFSHTLQWESYYNHVKLQKEYGGGSYGLYGEQYGQMPEYKDTDTMSPAFLFEKRGGKFNGYYTYDYGSDESWGPRYDENVLWADPYFLDGAKSTPSKWVHALDLADLYRTGVTNTTNIAFSKSGKDYSSRISFTNTDRDGIQYDSKAIRRFLSVKTAFKPTPWLNVSLDYKYTYRKNHNAGESGYSSIMSEYTQWGQTNVDLNMYKTDYVRPDGSFRTWNPKSATNLEANYHYNSYAMMTEQSADDVYNWNVFTGDAEILLPYNLKAGFRVNGSMRNSYYEQKIPLNLDPTSKYEESQSHISDLTLQGRLTWGQHFLNDQLSVDAAVFGEERQYHYGYLRAYTNKGLIINNFFNLSNSTDYVTATNTQTHYMTRAVYGTATVGYKDTYFLDANLRNDWDSRLSKSKNSYLYGGLSASVMLSNIIAKDSKWLNYWKLRASAAQVGSTLGAYAVNDYYRTSKYNSDLTLYSYYVQVNPDIKPTISTSYEIGTEFRLFNNRFWGDINYYTKDTKNQILNLNVAPQSGFQSRQINAGLIRNNGIEVSLGVTAVKTPDLQWDIEANFAHNSNKLVKLSDDMHEYRVAYWKTSSYMQFESWAVEGQPIGEIRSFSEWKRDDNGNLILAPSTSTAWGGGWAPQYVMKSASVRRGSYQPDLIGGFSTDLRFKNITVGANFDFMIGGQIASITNIYGEESGLLASTSKLNDKGINEREPVAKGGGVHVTGVDANGAPVDCYMNAYQYYHNLCKENSLYIYDRTYLKLRELSLGYQFTKKQLQSWTKGNITNASISFVATNPWLIYSAVPNIDSSEITNSFYEGGAIGSTRSFGLTVKLGF
ncbi:MAG: SusC/RagA family TonB-linked outer membrane protein [Bacteroidaceae bacterium]|nr:SusC/RagA family TonB-linked outer membrane protein [Bacteroidaceae bacterium]